MQHAILLQQLRCDKQLGKKTKKKRNETKTYHEQVEVAHGNKCQVRLGIVTVYEEKVLLAAQPALAIGEGDGGGQNITWPTPVCASTIKITVNIHNQNDKRKHTYGDMASK